MKWAEHNDLRLTFKKQEGSSMLGKPQLGLEDCVKRDLRKAEEKKQNWKEKADN